MGSGILVGADKKWKVTLASLEQLRRLSHGFRSENLDMVLKKKLKGGTSEY